MIVRMLIEEIIADVDSERGYILLTIHWMGGNHSIVRVPKTHIGNNRYTTDKDTVTIISELVKMMRDGLIASTLNRLGLKTGQGKNWTKERVKSVRSSYGIAVYDPLLREKEGIVNMDEAAILLHTHPMAIRRLIERGIIKSRQVVPNAPHMIQKEQLQTEQVRDAIKMIGNRKKSPLTNDENQISLNLL
jgi:hypothetical protein